MFHFKPPPLEQHLMPLEQLPQELIGSILARLDKRSVIAAIQTAKFMRREGERLLYSVVTFPFHDDQLTRRKEKAFVRAIVRNSELGLHVRELAFRIDFADWFYPSVHGSGPEKNPSAITRTIGKSMPNLKVLDLDVYPTLTRTTTAFLERPTPFQLKKLELNAHGDCIFTKDQIFRILQNQPDLRYFALPLEPRRGPQKEARVGSRSAVMVDVDLRSVCPLLEVLEGGYWVVLTFLPGRRVKHLLWTGDSSLSSGTYSTDTLLAPPLCEAYSRLEIISLWYSSTGITELAPRLASLKCLVLHGQHIWNTSVHSRTLDAVRQITGLERIFIAIHNEHGLFSKRPHEDIFNPQGASAYFLACASLKTITVLGIFHVAMEGSDSYHDQLLTVGYMRGQRGEPLAVSIPDDAVPFRQVPLYLFFGLANALEDLLSQSPRTD